MDKRRNDDTREGRASRGDGPRARGAERRAPRDDAHDETNVNGIERALSVVGGGALALYASRRRDWTGLLLGVASGALIERGVSGQCPVYGALGVTTASEGPVRADRVERQHGRSATVDAKKATKVERAVTIYGRSPEELYEYWRKLENLLETARQVWG